MRGCLEAAESAMEEMEDVDGDGGGGGAGVDVLAREAGERREERGESDVWERR